MIQRAQEEGGRRRDGSYAGVSLIKLSNSQVQVGLLPGNFKDLEWEQKNKAGLAAMITERTGHSSDIVLIHNRTQPF